MSWIVLIIIFLMIGIRDFELKHNITVVELTKVVLMGEAPQQVTSDLDKEAITTATSDEANLIVEETAENV